MRRKLIILFIVVVVMARKESREEDVANFHLNDTFGNFATNSYKFVN